MSQDVFISEVFWKNERLKSAKRNEVLRMQNMKTVYCLYFVCFRNRNQNIKPALVSPKGKESQMPVKPQLNTKPKR